MLRKTTVVTTFGGFPFDGFDGLALAVIVNGEQDAAGLLPHINANHPRGGAAGTVVARLLGHAVNDAAALAPHRFVHLVPNANEAVAMYLGVTGFGLKQVVVANVGAGNVQVSTNLFQDAVAGEKVFANHIVAGLGGNLQPPTPRSPPLSMRRSAARPSIRDGRRARGQGSGLN